MTSYKTETGLHLTTILFIYFHILESLTSIILSFTLSIFNKCLKWFNFFINLLNINHFINLKKLLNVKDDDTLFENEIYKSNDFINTCKLFRYESKEYEVQTKDGYKLIIFRIYNTKGIITKKSDDNIIINKPVIVLQHGLGLSSDSWITQINDYKNLPFYLVELGYDVWILNSRGNKYSNNNYQTSSTIFCIESWINSFKFWNFKLINISKYDLPDSINFIINKTEVERISFIGFNQGFWLLIIALILNFRDNLKTIIKKRNESANESDHEDDLFILNDKINCIIGLSPSFKNDRFNNIIDEILSFRLNIMYLKLFDFMMIINDLIIYSTFGFFKFWKSLNFWNLIINKPIFIKILDFLYFEEKSSLNDKDLKQKILSYSNLLSNDIHTRSIIDWNRILHNGKIDWDINDDNEDLEGKEENKNLESIKKSINIATDDIPIFGIYGEEDDTIDLDRIKTNLTNIKLIPIPRFKHFDLLIGEEINKTVIPQIVDILDDYKTTTTITKSVGVELKSVNEEGEKVTWYDEPDSYYNNTSSASSMFQKSTETGLPIHTTGKANLRHGTIPVDGSEQGQENQASPSTPRTPRGEPRGESRAMAIQREETPPRTLRQSPHLSFGGFAVGDSQRYNKSGPTTEASSIYSHHRAFSWEADHAAN